MMDLSILPECYVDTNLLETIVPPEKGYNHQKGCATVAKKMQEKLGDIFALGIIDKDKKQIRYLQEFEVWVETGNLILHKHLQKPHYIIQIVPAVERFILKCVEDCQISLENYNLPCILPELTKQTKQMSSKNDHRFKQLFAAMKESPDMVILKEWIVYLKKNPYNADKTTLQQLGK